MGVWIIAEHKTGIITDGTLEAISAGRLIAAQSGSKISAVILGHNLDAQSNRLSDTEIDDIYILDSPSFSRYASDAYIAGLYPFIKTHQPSVILIPSTCLGRDLAPKLAARLKTAYVSDVNGVEVNDRKTFFGRPVYGGRLVSAIACRGDKPWIITLRPRAFEKPISVSKISKIEKHPVDISPASIRTMVKGIEQTQKGFGLTEADIIISGGRGMKGAENFKILEELANVLGGVIGASGAAVDAGWMPHSAQVGQTGKVVSPKLYIACGISGAPQHLAGMSTSKCIVAINKDPDAPIFKVADYGIVGDLFEVVPMLIEELSG